MPMHEWPQPEHNAYSSLAFPRLRHEPVDEGAWIGRREIAEHGCPGVRERSIDRGQVDGEGAAVAGVGRIVRWLGRIADVHEDVALHSDCGIAGEWPVVGSILRHRDETETRRVRILDVIVAARVLTEHIAE